MRFSLYSPPPGPADDLEKVKRYVLDRQTEADWRRLAAQYSKRRVEIDLSTKEQVVKIAHGRPKNFQLSGLRDFLKRQYGPLAADCVRLLRAFQEAERVISADPEDWRAASRPREIARLVKASLAGDKDALEILPYFELHRHKLTSPTAIRRFLGLTTRTRPRLPKRKAPKRPRRKVSR